MPNITSAIFAIIFKIWALMCIKTTVPARMVRGLARTAAAIRGCCKVSRRLPVPAMVTEAIRAPAAKRNLRRSIPAAIVIATALGKNIPAASIAGKAIAEIAVHPAMTMLRTA